MTWRVDWPNAVALVTGASSGIGYETALAFAKRGARVVGVARREDRLRELVAACDASFAQRAQVLRSERKFRAASRRRAKPIRWASEAHQVGERRPSEGLRASYLAGDLGDQAFAERIVADTLARHGRIDVLVNNAAMPKHKQIYDLSPAEAEIVMRVNFLSPVWTTLAALRPMLAQGGGAIVNVSSFAALVTPPRETIYAASKAALNAWSAGLWNDLHGSGVHVAIVNPGAIETEIWGKLDEPPAFSGRKHSPQIVVDAILACVEERRHERTVPRGSLGLLSARLMRAIAPGLMRRAMATFDPVPADVIAQARARASDGKGEA
jgi:short-subunit dehydrogenase